MEQVLKTMLENVRAKSPLVHNITNYVTVNDVANVLLAAGGSTMPTTSRTSQASAAG